jgi:GTP-binding protein Era
MENHPVHRSGYVAIVGRPNVGKSTLLNTLVGEKISIVTSRPHTTRHAIVGVLTKPAGQIVFIDTPGLAAGSGRLLNKAMNKAAVGALAAADLVLLMVEAGTWRSADDAALETAARAGAPCLLVLNKIDRVKPRERLLPLLAEASQRHDFAAIVPVSARSPASLEPLVAEILERLPEQEALYGPSTVTTRDTRFRVAEVLREKLMQALRQEVPYGLGVEVTEIEYDERGRLCAAATVWVDRESHKGIVVGRGGQVLKQVGQAARLELQELLDCRVHLESHVKVRKNWSDNADALRDLGYDGQLG